MYANTYLKIAEKLNQELNKPEVTDIHGKLDFIARFNNQFDNESREHAIPKPAILIQFLDTIWKAKSKKIQEGTTLIVIHVAQSSLADDNFFSDNKEKALLLDAYMDLVHKAIQGFSKECIGSFNRLSSAEDPNHDHVFVQTMTYQSIITDNSANSKTDLTEVKPDIEVVGEKKLMGVEKESPYRVHVL